VPLEKNADLLIADHARTDVPPGSYSWKFIEDSVKSAVLQEKENYVIGRPLNVPRVTGSSEPAKKTRTKFTEQDDDVLARWVAKHHEGAGGNKIYQDLEQIVRHIQISR
jgi:hypothetical protein